MHTLSGPTFPHHARRGSSTPDEDSATGSLKRRTQVDEWASNLKGVADDNEKLTHVLEERMRMIMRPRTTEAVSNPDEEMVCLVPMAEHLRDVVMQLHRTNDRLRDILERAEL